MSDLDLFSEPDAWATRQPGDEGPANPLLAAALRYLARGWSVIPLHAPRPEGRCTCGKDDCSSPGKHPRIRDWPNEATRDAETVRRWWHEWPDANLGIVTGTASRLVVLDVDRDHGGFDSLAALELQQEPLRTLTASSGGGGLHFYIQHPGGEVRNAAGVSGWKGLDVPGDGGYIVAPPSRHASGNLYSWADESAPPCVMPEWLRSVIVERVRRRRESESARNAERPLSPESVLRGAPEGERHARLLSEAGRLRRKGLSLEEGLVLLLAAAKECTPPVSEPEVRTLSTDVWTRYPSGRPQTSAPEVPVDEVLRETGLLDLPTNPPPADVEPALRILAGRARDADALRRRTLRGEAVRVLTERKVVSAAALVDAALGTAAPARARGKGSGQALVFEDPEQWPDPVDASVMLDQISELFRRYVILPDGASDALALWVVFTWTLDSFRTAPRLALLSPEKRCGKTRTLTLLGAIVRRPLASSNTSAAAIYRSIEAFSPTLLIDEADTFVGEKNELRGILNSGHTRATAFVLRVEGDPPEPHSFSTWSAIATAAIGRVADTLADRSVIIAMRRRAKNEEVASLREDRIRTETEPLRRRLARFAADTADLLRDLDPTLPEGLDDRAADNWRPLVAIADAAGGTWPDRARGALAALAGRREEDSPRILLLRDVREILDGRVDISSEELVAALIAKKERPWADYAKGKPLTENRLARLHKPFGVSPRDLRLSDGAHRRGYRRSDFAEVWERYLGPVEPAAPSGFDAGGGASPP